MTAFIPSAKPVIDGYEPEWTHGFYAAANIAASGFSGSVSESACERPAAAGNVTITTRIV